MEETLCDVYASQLEHLQKEVALPPARASREPVGDNATKAKDSAATRAEFTSPREATDDEHRLRIEVAGAILICGGFGCAPTKLIAEMFRQNELMPRRSCIGNEDWNGSK